MRPSLLTSIGKAQLTGYSPDPEELSRSSHWYFNVAICEDRPAGVAGPSVMTPVCRCAERVSLPRLRTGTDLRPGLSRAVPARRCSAADPTRSARGSGNTGDPPGTTRSRCLFDSADGPADHARNGTDRSARSPSPSPSLTLTNRNHRGRTRHHCAVYPRTSPTDPADPGRFPPELTRDGA